MNVDAVIYVLYMVGSLCFFAGSCMALFRIAA